MEQKEMVFNPEANYMWKPEDVFEINGKQLEIVHNVVSTIINGNPTPAQLYLSLFEAFKVTSTIIKDAVESGNIIESTVTEQTEIMDTEPNKSL